MTTQIGFSTQRRSPLSAFIRFASGAKASHCWFLYYDQDWQTDMVMDAADNGFRLITFDNFKLENEILEIVTPKHSIDSGLKIAVGWLGSRYDYPGLLGMLIVLIGRKLRRKWKNPLRSTRMVFCSESVIRVLQSSVYPGSQSIDPETATPDDVLRLLRSSNV